MRGVGGFDIIRFTMKRLLLAVGLAAHLAANADGEKMTWGLMMQLGHNMWGEAPLSTEGMTEKQIDKYARDFNRTEIGRAHV